MQENKMGVMPVNRLLLSMAIPIIISMLVQALYNIVDSIFVGKLSEDALNAVSLAFPMQNLIIAVAVGTGVGVNALLSRSLGEKRQDMVTKTAMNGLFLAAASYVVFAIIGLIFSRYFFTMQTDVSAIIDYGSSYLFIVLTLSFGVFFQVMFERLLQATGRSMHSMFIQLTGALINIILDPILIFGLFGFPRLEVAGAAIATVCGQIVGALLGLLFNLKYNTDITLHIKGFRPNFSIIKQIYNVGIPAIAMSSIGSIMVFGMNQILLSFTKTATAVFGIYFKLQSFIFMPVFGLNNGMVPIISYNYGARKPDRIIKTIKLAVCYAVAIMLVGFAAFQLFTPQLLQLFEAENASGELIPLGTTALRIISFHFIFAGFSIVSSSVFQAMGRSVISLAISLIRQLAVLLPTAFILSRVSGLNAVWWSFPFAELFAVVLCALFLRSTYKIKILPLYDNSAQ